MTLEIDTATPLRRPIDLQRLVRAVIGARPEDEADWVEWKRSLDLASRHGQFHVARTILGFANRHPERAGRNMQGLAYLIVGAEPGRAAGITPLDSARLDQGLTRYLGTVAPQWNPTYVSIESADVLVVVVESPTWGDPIYKLRRPYADESGTETASDGTVFIRRGSRTVRATADDLDMLENRAKAGAYGSTINVEVGWHGDPPTVPVVKCSDEDIQVWLQHERERCLAPLENRREWLGGLPAFKSREEMISRLMLFEPERRSPDDYVREVDAYLEKCRRALVGATVAAYFKQDFGQLLVEICNPSIQNLPSVELQLYFDGDAFGNDGSTVDKLPSPPWPFGKERPLIESSSLIQPLMDFGQVTTIPNVFVENGGSVTFTYVVGDLRPESLLVLDPVQILVPIAGWSGGPIAASWRATSTGLDGVAVGELLLNVSQETLTPISLLRRGASSV